MTGEIVDWGDETAARDDPPDSTTRWAERHLAAAITGVQLMKGGISSAVHLLTLDDPDRPEVVMRRMTNAAWVAREPEIPFAEEHILGALRDLDVGTTTPTLIAADPAASETDVPTILMTVVPGVPDIDPAEPIAWADALAACLARLHETPAPQGLAPYRRWDDPARGRPRWLRDASAWDEAHRRVVELPDHPHRFIHRDYHPCNIHWSDGEIVGIVDWLSATTGPVAVDLSHCRWNLAILCSIEIADHFLDHYRSLTGYGEDVTPYDLSTVLSAPLGDFPTFAWNELGRADLTPDVVATKIEDLLVQLVDRR